MCVLVKKLQQHNISNITIVTLMIASRFVCLSVRSFILRYVCVRVSVALFCYILLIKTAARTDLLFFLRLFHL